MSPVSSNYDFCVVLSCNIFSVLSDRMTIHVGRSITTEVELRVFLLASVISKSLTH